jgi:bacteriocin biosynthesis cyclodehydratase domain-containing protein
MAAAVRLTVPRLLGTGAFGATVTSLLHKHFPAAGLLDASALDRAFDGSGPVVCVFWRPEPDLCDRADELAHETGTPWLPITKEGPIVAVGPWVSPGAGPCYRCCVARRRQHDREWPSTSSLHDAYRRDPSSGPSGFLPQHARFAAGIARMLLGAAGRGVPATGEVTTLSTVRLSVEHSRLRACHGCPRCGAEPLERDLRSQLGFADRKEPAHA